MPRSLDRRNLLKLTTGAALVAPTTLQGLTAAGRSVTSDAERSGPARRLHMHLFAFDESPVPGPFQRDTGCELDLEIAEDGGARLTVTHPDRRPDDTLPLPSDLARELDRLLFGVETDWHRRRREKREAGMIACPFDHYGGRCEARLCDEDRLVFPSAITAHLGPWITAEEVRRELRRIPAEWGPVVDSYGYWVERYAERLAGTSEDGRIEGVEIQLHGLGWGTYPVDDPTDLPWGPSIDLWPREGTHHIPDTDLAVEWCAFLPGDPVHGGADTVAEAIDQAVASLRGRLASLAVAA